MTPPEHFFIGASLANIIFSFQSFFKSKNFNYPVLLLLMGTAAMFPDIDSFFGHYVSTNPTIGHRGMTHSFLGVIFFGFFLTSVTMALAYVFIHTVRMLQALFRSGTSGHTQHESEYTAENTDAYCTVKSFWILSAAAVLAGISHIIADLFQPPGVWQGIPLFFPLKSGGEYIRHGGFAMTGWYDYKIMWLFIKAFLMSLPLLVTGAVWARWKRSRKISSLLFTLIIIINSAAFLILTDYITTSKYTGRYAWEKKQALYLRRAHPLERKITLEGRKKFLQLFMKSTH